MGEYHADEKELNARRYQLKLRIMRIMNDDVKPLKDELKAVQDALDVAAAKDGEPTFDDLNHSKGIGADIVGDE